MDPLRFVERVVTMFVRLVLFFVRTVWRVCAGVAELVVPKAVPGLRIVVTAIILIGVVIMFRTLLAATDTGR